MKKLLLTCLLFLIATFVNAQVTLGSGTTQGGYAPVDVNYGYNYTQQIFTKSEINATAAGNITGIKFYLPNNADITKSVDWVVYVGHTTKTSFSSTTDWVAASALTQVFSGAVSIVGGEVTVNFSSPFAYNNTDNLLIAIDENTADYTATSNRFYTYTGPTNSGLHYRSDTVNPDPFSPAAGTRSTVKSVTSLLGLTAATVPTCPVVSAPAAAATNVSVLPTITWGAVNYATSYKVSVGTTPGGTNILNMQDVGVSTSYTFTNSLNFSTQYYYTVYASNSAGISSACAERSFTTATTLGCPTVSAPSTAQTGLPVRTTFTWSLVSGALGYRLNIGTSAGASNVLANFDLGNVATYTLTTAQQLNPSTQYYYTIVSYNGTVVSSGCTERSFTTTNVVAPSNDDCAGAVMLTVNPSLTCTATTPGNTLGSSMSMAATPCSGAPNDDVWYKFVATSSSHLVTLSNVVSTGIATGITDMYFQVLSGSCGTMTSVLCSDPEANMVTGLTAGQTYYIRVYTYTSTANGNASFDICVSTPPAPPANDDCANAVTVTVNPDTNCGTVTSGTTSGGTSSGVAVGACSGTPDDDVWYKFTATATAHTLQLKNVVSVGTSSSISLYAQVFSGTCGTLTSTTCVTSNANFTLLSGLTVGQTYYVRVYNSEANSGASLYANTFDICIGTLPAAPANDECSAAVSLTVSPNLNCASPVAGTTLSATSSGVAVGTCTGVADDDVWYSFTATGTDHTVLLSNVVASGSSSSTSLYTQVFSGVCGTLTSIKCGTTVTTPLTGLTPGQVYYVRVYNSNTNGTTVYANNFNICIGTPPPPPVNDNCSGAVALTVNPDYLCGSVTSGTTVSATASTETAPTCGATGTNDDVWFKFTATNSAHRVSLSNVSGTTDMAMAIYSGSCGSLVHVMCSDPNIMNVTGLTVGQEYKVRVWTYTATVTTTATFDICVGTPPPPPANDNCSNATSLTPGNTFAQNALVGTTDSSTNTPALTATCLTTPTNVGGNVWYSVVVPASGNLTIETDAVTGSPLSDTVMSVFADCTSTTSIACNDDDGNGNFSKISLTGQTPGATLYVSVWKFSTATDGAFQVSAYDSSIVLATGETKAKDNKLKAYPNPFADVLNISDVSNVKSISVVDISGKLVKTFDKPESTLHLGGLNSGMYLVVLNMKDGSKQTIKAIKK
ncbi:T9SS type A sorting domain-containing protein [Chryseobacterium scophthalmum]|uniref:T9SS type A sorting domain-containing protein n=1 Tax=Chryseobacterium scophthalmum TaxID=59733 RepID=UPI00398AF101